MVFDFFFYLHLFDLKYSIESALLYLFDKWKKIPVDPVRNSEQLYVLFTLLCYLKKDKQP